MAVSGCREVAAVANCLLCDSLFVVVLGTVPPAKEFPGRKGKSEFEDLLVCSSLFTSRGRYQVINTVLSAGTQAAGLLWVW